MGLSLSALVVALWGCKPSNVINISSLTPETDDQPSGDSPSPDPMLANLTSYNNRWESATGFMNFEWISTKPTPLTIEYSVDVGTTWLELISVSSDETNYFIDIISSGLPDAHYLLRYRVGLQTYDVGDLHIDTEAPVIAGGTDSISGCDNEQIPVTIAVTDNLSTAYYIQPTAGPTGSFLYCMDGINDCYFSAGDAGATTEDLVYVLYDSAWNESNPKTVTLAITDCP